MQMHSTLQFLMSSITLFVSRERVTKGSYTKPAKRRISMFRPSRILVPTDFSDPSRKAIEYAIDLAQNYNAQVFVLHVITELTNQCAVDYCLDYQDFQALDQKIMKTAEERLKSLVEGVLNSPHVPLQMSVRKGRAYDEILKEEKEKQIDLLVIASLGHGFGGHLIGSVARNILKGSICPVFLVK
jgi:universal stress protein A